MFQRKGKLHRILAPEGTLDEIKVEAKKHLRRMHHRHWSIASIILSCLPLPVFFYYHLLPFLVESDHIQLHSYQVNLDAVKPCRFEHLEAAFSLSQNATKQAATSGDKCWRLADEIIRVPVERIVNRNNMKRLGNGRAGSVTVAILDVSRYGGSQAFCSVALKTDFCRSIHSNPFSDMFSFLSFSKQSDFAKTASCVQPDVFQWWPLSFLGGEYTGALAFYSRRRQGLPPLPGLIPTWAMVYRKKPLFVLIPRWLWWGSRHEDSRVVGVIMPLDPFTAVLTDEEDVNADVKAKYDALEAAKILYTAAEGLDYVHQLGLVFQDIYFHNIATRDADGTGIVTDNSFMTLTANRSCTQCTYCLEKSFAPESKFYWFFKSEDTTNALEIDLKEFRHIVLHLMKPSADRELVSKALEITSGFPSAREIARVLVSFLQSKNVTTEKTVW